MPTRKKLTCGGLTATIDEWASMIGIHPQTLRSRIRKWGETKALLTPKGYREPRSCKR